MQAYQELAAELKLSNVTVGRKVKLKNYKVLERHRLRAAGKSSHGKSEKKKKTFNDLVALILKEAAAKNGTKPSPEAVPG